MVVLEVTASNERGKTLYSATRTWQEVGLDAERRMQYGAWLIKEIIDLSLPPLATQRERFVMHFPADTSAVKVQATLRYHLGGDPGETVKTLSRSLKFALK